MRANFKINFVQDGDDLFFHPLKWKKIHDYHLDSFDSLATFLTKYGNKYPCEFI